MSLNPPTGNITSLNQIFSWTNGAVDNLLFPGILEAIFFIIFIRLLYSTYETGKAFAAASFICMIIAVMLRTADLISTTLMVIFIVLTAVGAIWLQIENA